SVLMWGANHNGQLGDGSTDGRAQPTVALPFAVRELTMGEYHACALLVDGTTTERHSPTAVTGLSGVEHIDAGDMHTCALLVDGTVSCWGLYESVKGSGTGSGPNQLQPWPVPGLAGVAQLADG